MTDAKVLVLVFVILVLLKLSWSCQCFNLWLLARVSKAGHILELIVILHEFLMLLRVHPGLALFLQFMHFQLVILHEHLNLFIVVGNLALLAEVHG